MDTEAIQIMKNSTRQKYSNKPKTTVMFSIVFLDSSKDPSLLSYNCLAEFFTGTHRAATDLQRNFLPTSYWLARHVTSAPLWNKVTPTTVQSDNTERSSEGKRGRWWRQGGGGRVKGGRDVNSHVTGPSCSVDGKREIQQTSKRGDR